MQSCWHWQAPTVHAFPSRSTHFPASDAHVFWFVPPVVPGGAVVE
jgi:hypothetical protein